MTPTRAMSKREQTDHERNVSVVRSCLSALRLSRIEDEDVAIARARLDNWLTENDGRWTK